MDISRRTFLQHSAAAGTAALISPSIAPAATDRQQHRAIVLWFAHNVTSAATKDQTVTEADVADTLSRCADHGINTIYFQGRYVGPAIYHSKIVAPFDVQPWLTGAPGFKLNEMHAVHGRALADVMERFDPLDVTAREAKRRGLAFIAQISIFDLWFPILRDRFYEEHPEYLLVDRTQKIHAPGLPCYADPGAQEYCLAEIRELLDRGAEGISLHLGSHQVGFWSSELGPVRPDSLGFNMPLVEAFQDRYGVNVLTEDFDLVKWRALHAEFFTGFLRRVKTELKDRPLIVGAPPESFLGLGGRSLGIHAPDYASQTPACRIDLEWERWLQEGIVDAIRVYAEPPHNVSSVERMKHKQDYGEFYFGRETYLVEEMPAYRQQIAEVENSILDGFVIHEESNFEPQMRPRLWEIFATP